MSNKRDFSQVPSGSIITPEKRTIDPYEVPSHFADDPEVQAMHHGHGASNQDDEQFTPQSEEAYKLMYDNNQPEMQEHQEEEQEQDFEPETTPQAPQNKPGGHFKALKESYERERQAWEAEREEYRRREAEYLRSLRPQASAKKEIEEVEEDLLPIDGDDNNLVEIKDVKRIKEGVKKTIDKKTASIYKLLEEQREELRLINARARVNVEMPDYSSIVTPTAYEQVVKTDPYFVESLELLKDPYKQAASIYKFIKNMGINQKVETQQRNRSRIEENMSKPRNSFVSSSLSQSGKYENMSREERESWLIRQNEEAIRSRR